MFKTEPHALQEMASGQVIVLTLVKMIPGNQAIQLDFPSKIPIVLTSTMVHLDNHLLAAVGLLKDTRTVMPDELRKKQPVSLTGNITCAGCRRRFEHLLSVDNSKV